jgi:anti-sigma factor RsiW
MEPRPLELACERYVSLIQDAIDGELTGEARAELDRHVAACPDCLALLADLEEIARVSDDLPVHTPRPQVWSRIRSGLAQDQAARPRPFWTGARVMLAMAATLVVGVGASLWVLRAPALAPAGTQAAVTQSGTDLVQDVDEHLRIADAHYEQAIAGLEKVVTSDQAALDPAVAQTLQKNLGVIDQAIRESREAIQTQPHSELAQTSLFEALRQKVALLEDTIALINVMRKGDQAGAARIVKGMTKS